MLSSGVEQVDVGAVGPDPVSAVSSVRATPDGCRRTAPSPAASLERGVRAEQERLRDLATVSALPPALRTERTGVFSICTDDETTVRGDDRSPIRGDSSRARWSGEVVIDIPFSASDRARDEGHVRARGD